MTAPRTRHLTVLLTGLSAREDAKYERLVDAYNAAPLHRHLGLRMLRMDNEKEHAIYGNVVRTVTGVPLRPSSGFIRLVEATVLDALRRGILVTVIGYSYGGSVLERVAASLRQRVARAVLQDARDGSSGVLRAAAAADMRSRGVPPDTKVRPLRLFAFGSILVDPADLPGVRAPLEPFRVHHYLYRGDWPALTANKIDPRSKGTRWLTWLEPSRALLAEAAKEVHFGALDMGIFLHKNYPVSLAFPLRDAALRAALLKSAESAESSDSALNEPILKSQTRLSGR